MFDIGAKVVIEDSVIEFEPHRIRYDSIIIDGHYGVNQL